MGKVWEEYDEFPSFFYHTNSHFYEFGFFIHVLEIVI